MDFLKNLKISDDKHESGPTQPIPVAAPQPAKEENLFSKLGDALGGKKTPPAPPPVAAPPPREENLFSKLGDALSGKKTPPPPPPAPAEPENLFDRIGSALGHKPTPPPEPKKNDLFSQLTNTISGKKEEPPKPQSLGDKLNHALGGGAAGEAKEGKLDKAIDLFQEHVLKEGPQHNESAIEQLKDKQIADTLRKTLGIEKKDKN
ncbi:hypothetical protein EST38_g5597 [Candolleomyces aberdarensis]|uniref:Uncharacterized protein n=1 Tax=Candolleomyces aberdarensis TaxID=2316362 RepID=A0A4Q2DK20_9AGAR|nr:hypothetical protein EST38_g5597 [Candolleomyces aberdarensis]